jgi:para-nitrobenzyl esterase
MLRLPLAKFKIKGKVAPVQAQQPRRAPWRNPRMITGDMLILVPANALADSRDGANTFVYEFGWKSPVDRLGGCHALEIGFVFDTLRSPNSSPSPGRQHRSLWPTSCVPTTKPTRSSPSPAEAERPTSPARPPA